MTDGLRTAVIAFGKEGSMTYTYFNGEQDKAYNLNGMRVYAAQKPELDKQLETLITPFVQNQAWNILDACCGIGHLTRTLHEISPQSRFLGVDQTPYLIDEARKLYHDLPNVRFENTDVYDLTPACDKQFDISVSWKTISWLPSYEPMLTALLALTRRQIWLSSLFYDGDIDHQIRVREYQKEAGRDGYNGFYNVYSFPRFREFVLQSGAHSVRAYNFEIGIDLPRPPLNQMGTYTERLADGRRLQISGAVVMSWKIVCIDL